MNIAVIGGGWVGCHLSMILRENHKVTIFEKNKVLFNETSYNNQNRLHLGYHYSRNYKTRELCTNTHDLFLKKYGFSVNNVIKNYYCVPYRESIIDFRTYLKIFEGYDYEIVDTDIKNIEGCINTKEKHIDYEKCHHFFNEQLTGLTINEMITNKKIRELSENFDLVINTTNNHLNNLSQNNYYELTLTLIYEKIGETEFDSITMVDGDLFSIYPYKDNLVTFTDVQYTPIKKFNNIKSLNKFKETINTDLIMDNVKLFENKVLKYLPDFNDKFKYHSYFISTKSKIMDMSSDRYPVINIEGNIINCFTGKIQGIFIIEERVLNLIKNIINDEK